MRFLKISVFVLLCACFALAQQPGNPQAGTKPTPGFDINALDKAVDPCVDFYQFACGTWMAKNPIPPDQSRWGRFNELAERNRLVLKDILEKASAPDPKRSAVQQKIGDYYASCMDEGKINSLGVKPIEPELQRIAAIKDRAGLIDTLAYLNRRGVMALFSFGPMADLHDANQMIAFVDQGGMTLPDRDYYLKDDKRSVETREKYVAHVQKMFELLGDRPDAAANEARTVMAIETKLADAAMDRTLRRDPKNRDHKMSAQELAALAPNFEFPRYFTAVAAPQFTSLNVGNPEFFKAVNAQLATIPVDDLKTYLRWHVLRSAAPMLPKTFVDEQFAFNGKFMAGTQELEPRWKRCVASTDRMLGEALGQSYVDRTFGVEGKQRTLKMVQAIEAAMADDLNQLAWMSPETRKQAFAKLNAVANNIGYPDKWRDYSSVQIVRGDAIGNLRRAAAFEMARQINKIGQPVDKKEWGMTPPTVNAYYSPARNDINFPAGILQPPFFDKSMDDAVNFGGIGAVIGHELTHGFDDQGAKFDPMGNLRDWWTAADKAEFETRTGCIAGEYSQFVTVADVKLNGRLTLGENTADNGGVKLAYMALEKLLAGKQQPPIDGYTPEQRFFLGYSQIWCQNQTRQIAAQLAKTDPHSPGRWRVNGVVQNSAEFQKAFGCKSGQPMVRENACRVW